MILQGRSWIKDIIHSRCALSVTRPVVKPLDQGWTGGHGTCPISKGSVPVPGPVLTLASPFMRHRTQLSFRVPPSNPEPDRIFVSGYLFEWLCCMERILFKPGKFLRKIPNVFEWIFEGFHKLTMILVFLSFHMSYLSDRPGTTIIVIYYGEQIIISKNI